MRYCYCEFGATHVLQRLFYSSASLLLKLKHALLNLLGHSVAGLGFRIYRVVSKWLDAPKPQVQGLGFRVPKQTLSPKTLNP